VTRILLVGPRGHGGEEVYVRTILENPPAGVEYVPAGSFHEGAPGAPCRRVEEVLLNRLVHPLVIPDMGFRALALRERFDLVHVHAHPVRLARRGRTPLVMSEGSSSAVYLQDYLGWSDARLERAYARARRVYRALGIHDRLLNLERVSRAYVFSRWARDLNVRWGADPAKLDVVYPGFPSPDPVDRRGRETFTFLFVGTDFERKGGFEVVEAFAEVAGRRPEARLMLVCPDPSFSNPDRAVHSWVAPERKERVLARLQEMEKAGKAVRRPLLPQPALFAEAYPAADAFVMPSHAEGFGFTNVEALSFGLPAVSSTVGAIPETVDSGRTGLLVPPGDVAALASAMEGLLADPARARRLGDAGRADFLARFTRDRFRAELARVYRAAQSLSPPGRG
jgi:glycosyltransferase involved in cell wall biosynthesis